MANILPSNFRDSVDQINGIGLQFGPINPALRRTYSIHTDLRSSNENNVFNRTSSIQITNDRNLDCDTFSGSGISSLPSEFVGIQLSTNSASLMKLPDVNEKTFSRKSTCDDSGNCTLHSRRWGLKRTRSTDSFVKNGSSRNLDFWSFSSTRKNQSSSRAELDVVSSELQNKVIQLGRVLERLQAQKNLLTTELDAITTQNKTTLSEIDDLPAIETKNLENDTELKKLLQCLRLESSRASHLLQNLANLRNNLQPIELKDTLTELRMETAIRCYNFTEVFSNSLEEQLSTLSILQDSHTDEQIETLDSNLPLQKLVEIKERMCVFYRDQINAESKQLASTNLAPRLQKDSGDYCNEDNLMRIRVLKFGLETRRKHLSDLRLRLWELANPMPECQMLCKEQNVGDFHQSAAFYRSRVKHFSNLREQIKEHISQLNSILPTFGEFTKKEEEDPVKIHKLNNQIKLAREEINRISHEPIFLCQRLESAVRGLKLSISTSEEHCNAIKAAIRRNHKSLKKLVPVTGTVDHRASQLAELKSQLSALYLRLENADNVKHHTVEILADQDRRVHAVQTELKRVKEIYSQEKQNQIEKVDKLDQEKNGLERLLVETNQKISRLQRHATFSTDVPSEKVAYTKIYASDDLLRGTNWEVSLDRGRRCAFLCQEIQRLRKRTACLQEGLDSITSATATPAKITSINAMLRAPHQTSEVKRRPNTNEKKLTRPHSMTAADLPMRRLQLHPVVDSRRRMVTATATASPSQKPQPQKSIRLRQPIVDKNTPVQVRRRTQRSRSFSERTTTVNGASSGANLKKRDAFKTQSLSKGNFSAFRSTKFRPTQTEEANIRLK